MTLETLIAEANARGLQVNNLFQLGGGWRANVGDGDRCFEFGDGVSACEALSAALGNVPERPAPVVDLGDLLG